MLKRKLSIIIVAAIIINIANAPIKAFATTLATNKSVEDTVQEGTVQESKIVVNKFSLYGNSNLESYNAVYKLDRSKIKSITNNGGRYSTSTIDKAIDGNVLTHWETGTPNSTTFNNEVVISLNELETINRIVYIARQEGDKGKGFAEEFEIYTSTTDNGADFTLLGNGKYTGSTGDVVEMKFENTEVKRVKFVFKKANRDWASAAEFMLYKEDKTSEKINNIFTDNTMSSVKAEFNNIEFITSLENELEAHPLKSDLESRLQLAKDIVNGNVDFNKTMFTPKQNGDVVSHIRNDLKMTSFGTNLQSTGIVAKPGETFNIYVEAEEGKPLPQIAFTQQEGHYGNWIRTYSLSEGVNTIVVPEIYSATWSKKSTKGGAVYLLNPYTEEQQGKAPIVRIEGGEHFPLFNEGDNVNEFLEELKAYKVKLDANPTTMVDIFEFNAERLMFTGTTSAAHKVYINEGVDVNQSINIWDDQIDLGMKFAGLSDNSLDRKNDSTNVRTTIRLMQPFGAAYAASNHIGLQRGVMDYFIRVDKYSVNDIIWGTMHEVGHQMDIPARTWGEVTNNMWANYAAILNGKGDRINYEGLYKTLAPQDTKKTSEDAILEMFWQLQLANENYWPDLEKMYREKNPQVANYQEKKDILAKYSSEILGVNLTPYFEKYNFTLSESCKVELLKLPELDKNLWYLNTKAMNYEGNGFTDSVKTEITSIKNNQTSGTTLNFTIDEGNKDNLLGYEIIRDGKVIGFTSNSSFIDANVDINMNYKYEIVAYARDLSKASAVEIQSKTPILSANSKITIKLNEEFNPLNYVNAVDSLGNKISDIKATHNVDITKKGIYNILYEVTSNGITANKTSELEVVSDYEYLSDINWTSARTDWSTVKKDLALSGNKITLNVNGENKVYAKGIGTHANSEIVYNLEGKNYDYFESYVGIERSVAGAGKSSVIFKVFADGVEVYNSGVRRWEDEAKYVKIPVNGVSELKLVASDAGDGIGSDHANFADAKFLISNSLPTLNIPKSVSTKIGNPIDLKEEYSATDIEDGDLTENVEVTGDVNFDKTGEYTLTYKVTDSDENVITKTRTIAVVDMNDYTNLTDFPWKSTNYSYTVPKKDISISAKTLRLTDANGAEVSYERGIGAHSNSTIIYDLSDKNFDYFTSYVGVDRQAYGTIGSITFEVYVDGVKKFDSGLMNSTDIQKYIELDINGAKELKLVVTDAGNGNGYDHGTWGGTKLHYANENGISINRLELNTLMNTASELNGSIYTEESFASVQTALEHVKTNLGDGYTQEEVNNLYTSLKEAYEKLVKLTDYKVLNEVIENNSEYNELHYFKDVMTSHKAIIEEAKIVLGNKEATQEEVDGMVNKIKESAKTLVVRENKVELLEKINGAKLVENNNYIAVRWSNFCYGIQYASEVYNNVDGTDRDIRTALFMLEYYREELK